jgi:hypothetical protein
MPKNDEDAMWNVESDHKERSYKQNRKTVGDRWSEDGEQNLLRHIADDGDKAPRDISTAEFRRACDPGDHDTWKPGVVSRSGKPRYAPKGDGGTRQVSAASPTGRYGKPGGKGQRSGA